MVVLLIKIINEVMPGSDLPSLLLSNRALSPLTAEDAERLREGACSLSRSRMISEIRLALIHQPCLG